MLLSMVLCCVICLVSLVVVSVTYVNAKKETTVVKGRYSNIDTVLNEMTIKLVEVNDLYLDSRKSYLEMKQVVGELSERVEVLEKDNKMLKRRLKLYDTVAGDHKVIESFNVKLS